MKMTDAEMAAAQAPTLQTQTAKARDEAMAAAAAANSTIGAILAPDETPTIVQAAVVESALPAQTTPVQNAAPAAAPTAPPPVIPPPAAPPRRIVTPDAVTQYIGVPLRPRPAAPAPIPAQTNASEVTAPLAAQPAAPIETVPIEAVPMETAPVESVSVETVPTEPGPPEAGEPDAEPQSTPTRHTVDWKQSIPYDETGVLIRPAGWTDDQIETALLDVMALRKLTKKRPGETDAESRPRLRAVLGRIARAPRGQHAVLTAILGLQAALSLRNTNTAFMDEALYLYSGHLELGHLVFGAPLYDDYSTYLSGAPVFYPVVGALADQIGGVFAARLLSLLFMLGATGLLYLTTRRIFGVRAALLAAGMFATTEAVGFVGGLATYDAPAIFLLALAGWIVIRFARSAWPIYLLAVIPLILAVGTKYAALLFVPTVLALACFGALAAHGRWWALLRPVSLGLMFGAMVYGLVRLAGPDYWTGISSTTTARASGTTPTGHLLWEVTQWGGLMFAVAVLGGVAYIWRPKLAYDAGDQPGRAGRLGLVIVLLGTALLAPADQLHLHTDVSLYKHVGFGLLFAAPLAGYGMQRLIGAHYQRIQFGIAVFVVGLALGLTQTTNLFAGWADSDKLVTTLRHYTEPRGEYLVENSAPVIYYLRDDVNAEPYQIISTFTWQFTDLEGHSYSGVPAYTTAIRDDFFNVVVFDYSATPAVDTQILGALKANHDYYLTSTITQHTVYGWHTYYIWVKWEPGRK